MGLTIDNNKLTVGITREYRKQVKDLLDLKWPASWRIFKAADIQKLVGKMARLGEGVPWIYKHTSHIYTSLAFALKQNNALLLACYPKFREIVDRIERKQFSGNHSEITKELNFALKTAAKLVNSHKQVYLINETMQVELEFIRQAITDDSGIVFEVQLRSLFQELQWPLCSETAPFKPVADTPLPSKSGGIFLSQTILSDKLYFTSQTTKARRTSQSTALSM